MGSDWNEVKKGIYKDEHERPDVIQYPQKGILPTIAALLPRMPYIVRNDLGKVVDIKQPELPVGEKHCIPVTHDECTGNANDGPHHQWIREDEQPIRKKPRGQGLHISDFITP